MDSRTIQASELIRLVSKHGTWSVVDTLIDVASAKTDSYRFEFSRMIRKCENGSIDIILTNRISRFGLDAQECLEAIQKIRSAGERIVFKRDKIDTGEIGDELLISVIEACEQYENDWRSENIRWVLKKRVENGTQYYIFILAMDIKKWDTCHRR